MDSEELFYAIGARFAEERKRLKFSQRSLAPLIGTTSKTVIGYEKGDPPPKISALLLFYGQGADILYILTGERAEPHGIAEPRPGYVIHDRDAAGGDENVTMPASDDLKTLIALLDNDPALLSRVLGYVDGVLEKAAARSAQPGAVTPGGMIREHDFSTLAYPNVKTGTIE